eukprot:TRINITY_DN20212_c0_g1_i1.p1 TRINITY_DN20212_c0_g1~~TRINITY_DN20212_c0_g1_i1.p1  ORF type:complete len:550 (+),score=100.58 TRINITY_DN20212_c0_g1_i1:69-1652(+)
MEPAPQWTGPVERSCATVVEAVRSAGVEVEAEVFWDFLRRGGRPPAGSLPAPAAAEEYVYEYAYGWDSRPPPGEQSEEAEEGEESEMGKQSTEDGDCGEGEEDVEAEEDAEGEEDGASERDGGSGGATEEEGSSVSGDGDRRVSGDGNSRIVYRTELCTRAGLQTCSVSDGWSAGVAAHGMVLCDGRNEAGQRGTGDRAILDGLSPARLPWAAALVSCGEDFGVALCCGGAEVYSWGRRGVYLGRRGGRSARPAAVVGLPVGDPVIILEAGTDFVIAITAGDAAYGWGSNRRGELALACVSDEPVPVRIAALSGRRIRRLTCGFLCALAETDAGALLGWGEGMLSPRRVPSYGMAFPLLSMAGGQAFSVADGAGRVWAYSGDDRQFPYNASDSVICCGLRCAQLPEGLRMVRVAADMYSCIVALSACGQLWDCSNHLCCRLIGGAPLGLLPCGGAAADRIRLLPDISCGKARLQLFARIAVRLRLPCDPCRVHLIRFMVHGCYLGAAEDDPFGWPDAEAKGSGLSGR